MDVQLRRGAARRYLAENGRRLAETLVAPNHLPPAAGRITSRLHSIPDRRCAERAPMPVGCR